MHTHDQAKAPEGRMRIRGLDGIRACAFLLVLGGHSGFSWIPNGFGVTAFFFLSGYLITTLLRLEWIQTGSMSIPRFYIRRAFRILPPCYCALIFAIVLALAGVTHSEVHWKAVLAVQMFLTNYSEFLLGLAVPAGLTVLWSLAVEEHFYLIFPWGYRSLLRMGISRTWQAIFLFSISLLVLAWRSTLMTAFHTSWYRVYTGTDTRLDSILFGSILAIMVNPIIDNLDGVSRRRYALAAAIGVAVLIVSIAMRGEMFRQTVRYTIQSLALFPIFIYVIRYSDSLLTRFLEVRVLTHIGELSYSLYLVHYTILAAVNIWVKSGPVVTFALTLSLSYMLALIMRHYVEWPSNKMRNRMLKKVPAKVVLRAASAAS